MERVFTKNVGKAFSKGDVRSYPKYTWDRIAASAGCELSQFSKPADEAVKEGVMAAAGASHDKPKRSRRRAK